MKPPFDTVNAVNTLIYLYKKGYTTPELAVYFDTHKGLCLRCLKLNGIPIRSSYAPRIIPKDYEFAKLRYKETEKVIQKYTTPTQFQKGKYDDLFQDEVINTGKSYDEYLKEKGIKVPSTIGFDRMRRFKG